MLIMAVWLVYYTGLAYRCYSHESTRGHYYTHYPLISLLTKDLTYTYHQYSKQENIHNKHSLIIILSLLIIPP